MFARAGLIVIAVTLGLSVTAWFVWGLVSGKEPRAELVMRQTNAVTVTAVPTVSEAVIEALVNKVKVTGESDGAPPNCTPRDVARFIVRFMETFNRGDQAELEQFFGPFEWFSRTEGDPQNGGKNFVAYDVETLFKYFAARHLQGETMRLVALQVNGWDEGRGIVNFGPIVIARRANDLGAGEWVTTGKGAFHCQESALVVMSFGVETQTPVTAVPPPSPVQAPTALPQSLGEHPVYVLDVKNGGLVTELFGIDADARKTISTLALRYVPEILFSDLGDKMLVLDTYSTRVTRGETRDVLSVYDARSFEVLTDDVAVADRLQYMVFPAGDRWFFTSPDDKYLFVTKYGKPDIHTLRLAVLDGTTFEQVAEYPFPLCDGGRIEVMRDGRLLCLQGGTLYALAALNGDKTKLADVPAAATAFTMLSPKRDRWMWFDREGGVTVVDLTTTPPHVIENKGLGLPAEHTVGWSYQTVMNADGTRVYVGYMPTSGELYGAGVADVMRVFDAKDWEMLGEVRPEAPFDYLAVSRDGTQLYMTSKKERTLRIFDTGTLKEIGVMREVGVSPSQILIPN